MFQIYFINGIQLSFNIYKSNNKQLNEDLHIIF